MSTEFIDVVVEIVKGSLPYLLMGKMIDPVYALVMFPVLIFGI